MYNLTAVPTEPEYNEKGDTISFRQSELAPNPLVRNQPIVVQIGIHRSLVKRVLIDTGASRDILFYRCFREMGLSRANLTPTNMTLEGFTSHSVRAEGTIDLEVLIGEGRTQKTITVQFVVLDISSQFNVILGTPSQSRLDMVVSVPHQRVKFLTEGGVGCIRSNPRTFYENAMNERRSKKISPPEEIQQNKKMKTGGSEQINCLYEIVEDEVAMESDKNESVIFTGGEEKIKKKIQVETLDTRGNPEITGVSTREVIINPAFPEQPVRVGEDISKAESTEIISLLKENTDVFAWSPSDMKGVERDIVEHRLSIDAKFVPIQQRARQFSFEKENAIKQEVDKLLRAGIIKEVRYPTWLANVVMVLKANK